MPIEDTIKDSELVVEDALDIDEVLLTAGDALENSDELLEDIALTDSNEPTVKIRSRSLIC
jgi:hypothetical protein